MVHGWIIRRLEGCARILVTGLLARCRCGRDNGGMSESKAKDWCVYLLRCADDSLYCGISNDLAARLATHNAGKGARYTRARLPVVPVYVERCADRSSASKREAAIKRLDRAAKLGLIACAEQGQLAVVLQLDSAEAARPRSA